MTHAVMASAGFLISGLIFFKSTKRVRPLAKLQRGVTMLRAAGYMANEMLDGAMARRDRWSECVQKAKEQV